MLAGQISQLMNGMSHGTEARPCRECDVLMHCLAGRQTHLQQCCRSMAAVTASATLLGNTASWFYGQV